MKLARELTHKQLVELVTTIQAGLWFDDTGWNRDKEWEVDEIENIAHVR